MLEANIRETEIPAEVGALMKRLSAEYENTDISYIDYTHIFEQLQPEIIVTEGDKNNESLINLIGEYGDYYKTEPFVHAARHSLPDPRDEESRILIYPSFDGNRNITSLELLRCPSTLLKAVSNKVKDMEGVLHLPNDRKRLKDIPIVRIGVEDKATGQVKVARTSFNSRYTFMIPYIYSSEGIELIKRRTKKINWGNHTIYPYQNTQGENILLVLPNS